MTDHPAESLGSHPESKPEGDFEALFREARRRRRVRRALTTGGLAVVLLAVIGILGVFGDTGGGGHLNRSRSTTHPSAPLSSPVQTSPAGLGVVGRGPTSVDFTDPAHGWIASGNLALPLGNPTIVHTTNGGQTWQRTPVPNLAAQSVNPATRYALGGLVGIHFANAKRGWFFQAGIAWQTNNAGKTWAKLKFPVSGAVVALTSSDHDVWALLDTCQSGTASCSQSSASGSLYHATSAAMPTWRRIGGSVSGGLGSLYPAAGHAVVVTIGAVSYHRSVANTESVARLTGCQAVGSLTGGALAGICNVGGGGDASLSRIAISSDHGTTWKPLIDGPASKQYMGSFTTNGSDAVFYVTGGQTLWRTSASQPGWSPVLQVAQGSTDEIFPVFVEGTHGLLLVSNGADAHWYKTDDGGTNWQATTVQ